ncbi:DUF4350 domain-containing protein [Halorhabdus sp. CUG00001]|uniref:DUF4350 domain-containing protein n=1 Tax=Halorhabdus sp. CUG00001 TaxID=2600297 RepID=UPI00131E545C|nr:DUF4350 domain-containing protein [Halorhabdus sp. CUG00001]
MSSLGRYVAAFVVVLGAVLAIAAVGPAIVPSSAGTNVTGQSPAHYQPSNLALDTIEKTGTVAVDDVSETKTVVIDLAHSNSITREDVTPLISALVESGHEVQFAGGSERSYARESKFNATLQDADAYVVAAPSRQFTPDHVSAVGAYAEAGGRVLLLEESPSAGSVSSMGLFVSIDRGGIEGQLGPLGSRFDLAFGTSYLYNASHESVNFKAVFAEPTGEDPLLDGVEEVVFRDAVPVVRGTDATALLRTDDGTRLESTRESSAYTVLARNGNVTAVGDTTFLTPRSVQEGDNEVLVGNLATFLVDGQKDPCVPTTEAASSEYPSSPPVTVEAPSENTTGGSGSGGVAGSSQQC